jgi:hypothetical protein
VRGSESLLESVADLTIQAGDTYGSRPKLVKISCQL